MAVLDEGLDAQAAVSTGIAIGPYKPSEVEEQAQRLVSHAAAKPTLARWINRSVSDVASVNDTAAAEKEAHAQRESLRRRTAKSIPSGWLD